MLLEDLKQFKKIRPDAEFASLSRARILGGMRLRDILRENFPMAVATLALALLFIFAGTQFFGRGQVTIDPRGLRAEAQAIGIQIQLTNLNYAPASGDETTPATASGNKVSPKNAPSETDPIDDALNALSQ
jgi:hypothetical protein